MSVNVKKNGQLVKVAGAVDLSVLNYIAQAKAETEASASAAATSAQSAETDASLSKSYAVGTGGEVRPDDATENAKRYWEQTKEISESFAGTLRPKGTIAFSELPSVSIAEPGDMYNISDEFVTTSDFKEGAGLTIPLGSNIYLTVSRKWDVLAGSPVTGVKGDKEAAYHRGNVNITSENIGAVPRYRTEGKPVTNGWYRVAKFVGASAISFSAAIADKYLGIAPTEINFSVSATQMPGSTLQYDVHFLQDTYMGRVKVNQARIAIVNGYIVLDLNYTIAEHTQDDICVDLFNVSNNAISSFNVDMMFEKVEDEPELHYDYTFVNGGGRIADRAMTVDPSVFKTHEVVAGYMVSTNAQIDDAIENALESAGSLNYFEFLIMVNQSGCVLIPGTWYFRGFKLDSTNSYGYVVGEIYLNGYKFSRVKFNGSWGQWIKESFSNHNTMHRYVAATNDELYNYLNIIYDGANDNSYYEAEVQITRSDLVLSGGFWYITGYRTTAQYGYQEAKQYNNGAGMSYYARSKYENWTEWKNMVPA